jgi:hypothetical protein
MRVVHLVRDACASAKVVPPSPDEIDYWDGEAVRKYIDEQRSSEQAFMKEASAMWDGE